MKVLMGVKKHSLKWLIAVQYKIVSLKIYFLKICFIFVTILFISKNEYQGKRLFF